MQPFSGVQVLDVTHVLAGPFAAYQLSLLGADVIKIEPPRRLDMARGDGANLWDIGAGMGVEYQGQAANKRSLLLDLSCPAGQGVLRRGVVLTVCSHLEDLLFSAFAGVL
jgi:crotonobetainyl-CoA:carnitine CoA-transferase CaiB-like acyl-CoA transferase